MSRSSARRNASSAATGSRSSQREARAASTWQHRRVHRQAAHGTSPPPSPHRRAARPRAPRRERRARRIGRRRTHFAATSDASAARTRATTSRQPPGSVWRYRHAVGYHGLLSLPSSQRQPGANGSNTHSGRASAPARCAMLVSTLITRSSSLTIAAVASSGVSRRERRHPRRGRRRCLSRSRPARRAAANATRRPARRTAVRGSRARPTGCGRWRWPCCRPTRCRRAGRARRRQRRPHRSPALIRRGEVGHLRGNRREFGPEHAWQRQQRNVRVVGRQRVARCECACHTRHRGQQPLERRRAMDERPRAGLRQQRCIARELQRIAQSLLGVHEQCLAAGRSCRPTRVRRTRACPCRARRWRAAIRTRESPR